MTRDQAIATVRGIRTEAERRANLMERSTGKRTYISFAWRAIAEECRRALGWLRAEGPSGGDVPLMSSLQAALDLIREIAATVDDTTVADRIRRTAAHIAHSFETGSCAGIESYGYVYSWDRDDLLAAPYATA